MPQDQDRPITLEEFEEQRRKYYGIPSGLAESLRQQESSGRQYDQSGRVLTSPKQAKGRYQVLQSTADKYSLNADDPFENVEASFRYLSELHKQVDKNVGDPGERWAQTLAGYHAGEGRLREVNKTGSLPSTSDGLIRTDEYVSAIMNRWQQHDQGRSGEQTTQSQPANAAQVDLRVAKARPEDLLRSKPSRPPTAKERKLAADETARQKATPDIARMVNDFEALKREGSVDAARSVAAKIKQRFGKWMEVGEGNGWPYVKSRVPGWNPVQPLATPIITPSIEDQRQAAREVFAQKPMLEQWSERIPDALARGGGQVSKMARRALGAGMGAAGTLQGRPFEVVDFPAWRQGEEERMRNLEERQLRRPSSFATDVGEGIIEAIPAASGAILGTVATGGGLPAAMAIGGGMSAAGADWRDPERALTQTALGAVAPVVGGKVGAVAGRAAASRLASPAAQAAARALGELAGGGAGNVIGSGTEQLAFEGRIDPRELAKQAVVGAALNVPGAVGAARRPVPARPAEARPVEPPQLDAQETRILAERRAIDRYTQAVDAINRSSASSAKKAAQLAQARVAYQAERQAARQAPQAAEVPSAEPQVTSPAPDAVAAPVLVPELPPSVRVIRQGEQIPPREKGQRQIPIEVDRGDGTTEAVIVLAPDRIDGRRVNETMLRPFAEQAVRPQDQPVAQPDVTTTEAASSQPPPSQPSPPVRRQPPEVQFTQLPRSGLKTPRTPGGAIPAPESPIVNRKLLPPARGEEIIPTEPLSRAVQERIAPGAIGARRPQPPEAAPAPQAKAQPAAPSPKLSKAAQVAQERVQRAEAGQRIARKNRAEAKAARDAGDLLGAQKAYRAELQALQDAKGLLSKADVGKRGQLLKQIIDAERNLANVNATLKKQPTPKSASNQPQNIEQSVVATDKFVDESAPTMELPPQAAGQRRTAQIAEAALTEEPTNRIKSGEGAELPRGVSRPLEGQPIEMPGPRRPRTERLPVPKATPDNIKTLRARREELSRLAYSRRGEFPQDLADELRELGSRIIEFENEQAKVARGGVPDLAPPPGVGGPERAMTPADKAARRAALQPKPEGRQIQHNTFGLVTEAADQSGVPKGKVRVIDENGDRHFIQNPRTRGNREASFVRSEPKFEIPAEAMPELRDRPGPQFARGATASRPDAPGDVMAIPEEAAPELARRTRPRFVLDAEQRLKDAASGKLAGSGGQQLADAAIVAGWKVYETGMDFARWSAEVVKQVGEKVRPHLRAAWDQIQADYKQMQTEVATRKRVADNGKQIASRMARIVRTPTSPVEISKLRAEFKNLSKADFDAAMERLNKEGRIALQRHDHPASMSPAERASAVKIGNDYFTAATFRERPGTVMGMGPGALQGMSGRKTPKANPSKADIESASLGRAVGKVLTRGGNELRALWTSMDFSAPLSQGALLTIAHPIKGAQSFAKMFRSLSQVQSDAIDAQIAFHPLRKLGEKAGLFLATSAKLKGDAAGGEEAYRGTALQKVPGISHTERAYRTYLDTLRLSTWESYVKTLEAGGHTFENNPKAYRDAAQFVNIATGRGQLKKGGALEKASDLMGSVLFAPRNMIANFQVLDPVRYASLSPGARKVVLKDALTAFGAMVGTAAALNAAGAKVGFNPEKDDFMTARLGDTRYDLTFGKKTQVQFLARMTMGLYRKASGEGNLPGRDPLTVAQRFAEGKLAPAVGTAKTFITGKDFKGEKIADKSKAQIAWETAAPMLWRDMLEAYQHEGVKGVAKASPAAFGARVSTYPDRAKAAFLDVPPELREEQKRAGEARPFLTPRRSQGPNEKDETPGQFAARKALANQWTSKYGMELVSSQIYRSATVEEKAAARAYLKRTVAEQSGEQRPKLYLFNPGSILQAVRESQRREQRKAQAAASALQ